MMNKRKKDGFHIWKSGKKWFVSSGAIIITFFGPTNVVGAAEVIANATVPDKETSSSVSEDSGSADENTLPVETSLESSDIQETSQEEISSEEQLIEETEISEEEQIDTRLSTTVLDMDPSTEVAEDKILYNLSSDGNGWPDSAPNAKQLKISTGFSVGGVLVVKLGKGVSITEPGAPAGVTVEQKVVNGETQITYTSNVSITTASFDISYYFPKQADNQQFMPGDTTIPVTVESEVKTLTGSIIATNPINTTLEARTHNTVVKDNVYTADGLSVYNFVMGVKTTPDFTNFSSAVTQAIRAKGSGVIHVPEGFVLKGASLANHKDTDSNVPTDGSAIPGIPAGLAQPDGAGTDIIVSDVIIAGYNSTYNESFMYLYGYFEKGTPDGTYHFSPELTLTPQYFDGSIGSIQVDTGSLADITLGKANPGSMVPSYAGVLEYHSGAVDTDHAGFYSKSISIESGVSGFVTGKVSDTNINGAGVRPNVSIQFQDDTVNQTNTLKDYKLTLPDKWCGNLTDLSFSTDRKGIVSDTGNENKNGPFTVSLDNGQTFTVSAVGEEDQVVSAAIASGAHIVSVSGQADILAGNNLQSSLTNAVIEDGTYKVGDKVPIQLDVHSVTSNTDATAIGHLYYFDKQVSASSQFSIKNTLDYNIAGTYTQGQTFGTGSKWTLLNRETSSEDSSGKIILPVPNATADVKLPTLVISSVDKGMIDLDQSKIDQWGWTYDGKKYLPEIKDLGKDATTGEHLTELDFSQYTVTVPADINPEGAFMYPEALPWKVSDTAGPATGTTTHWITQLTDNNKDDLHPVYGGNVYDGSIGQHWTITVPGVMQEKIGLSGNRTGSTNFYTSATGMAGFDRGLTADLADDVNAGQVMLSLTNGFKETYSQVQTVVVLPSKDAGDVFTMVATGPVTNLEGDEAKALYSTKIYEVPADEANEAIDLTTNDWVAEDQVTDWSTIRSVAITAKSLEGESVLAGYVPVAIDKIETTKIGDIAEAQSWAHAKGPVPGSDINKNTPMKAQIYGTPQIKAHYEETTDGSTSNGTVLAEEVTITGENTNGTDPEYGEYKTNKKDIPGFTYKGLAKNSAPETGTLTDDTADVVYLYEREEQELQVHYINISGSDKASDWVPEDGVELKDSLQILTGKSGEEYTNELVIPKGYDLVIADPGATKGTFDIDSKVT
ncbi:MAG: MucBP domain-containing protein, partial [Vagococcus fluvialis]